MVFLVSTCVSHADWCMQLNAVPVFTSPGRVPGLAQGGGHGPVRDPAVNGAVDGRWRGLHELPAADDPEDPRDEGGLEARHGDQAQNHLHGVYAGHVPRDDGAAAILPGEGRRTRRGRQEDAVVTGLCHPGEGPGAGGRDHGPDADPDGIGHKVDIRVRHLRHCFGSRLSRGSHRYTTPPRAGVACSTCSTCSAVCPCLLDADLVLVPISVSLLGL